MTDLNKSPSESMSFIIEVICKCIFTDIHMINNYCSNRATDTNGTDMFKALKGSKDIIKTSLSSELLSTIIENIMVPACGAADVQHACTTLEVFTCPKIHTPTQTDLDPYLIWMWDPNPCRPKKFLKCNTRTQWRKEYWKYSSKSTITFPKI